METDLKKEKLFYSIGEVAGMLGVQTSAVRYWEKEFDNGFYSSPMIADGKVYITDMGGTTHIIRAGKEGTLVAEPSLGEAGFALPAFAEGTIYMRGVKHLYCIQ